MRENLDRAMSLLVVLEGGSVHHVEGDPGGQTGGRGVTQSTYDRFRRGKRLRLQSVANMSYAEETEILKAGYWDVCHCDDLPSELDLVVFQYAVNRGPNKAIRLLQRGLGVKADGIIGPITEMEAYCCDHELVIEKLLDYMVAWYGTKRKRDKFTDGLVNRVIKTAEFLDFPYSIPDEIVQEIESLKEKS